MIIQKVAFEMFAFCTRNTDRVLYMSELYHMSRGSKHFTYNRCVNIH